jgi:hypothetical protein
VGVGRALSRDITSDSIRWSASPSSDRPRPDRLLAGRKEGVPRRATFHLASVLNVSKMSDKESSDA